MIAIEQLDLFSADIIMEWTCRTKLLKE